MKNILLVNSSNRKKNTYNLLLSIETILKDNGFKTELITLSDYKIDFCKHSRVRFEKPPKLYRGVINSMGKDTYHHLKRFIPIIFKEL